MSKTYHERRVLRFAEKIWIKIEGGINRLTAINERKGGIQTNFNPLYHVNTLGIFLLIVLLVTGIYLTVVYRPSSVRAYESLEVISAGWFGSLMRSSHRYAADVLIVVIVLHAIKMFLSGRFWGSRWIAWVSGIVLLVLLLMIGTMGYFLIWDQNAQWLTEYFMGLFGGPIRLTFASPERAADAFGFFVIILFLHVFLSVVILVGLLIHEMRLKEGKIWSPRWVMIISTLILIGFSVWLPVASEAPADLTRIVGETQLNVLFLGFLPLSLRFSSALIWGASTVVLGLLTALPWLLKGRDLGPAYVLEDACTACAMCARECPYNAIEIKTKEIDDGVFESHAFIYEHLCVGCGLCLGDCPRDIDLVGLPTDVVAEALQGELNAAQGDQPVVVFLCQRHAVHNTIPVELVHRVEQIEFGDNHLPVTNPVQVGQLTNPHAGQNLIVCELPCTGMAQSRWIRGCLADGAEAVILLTCPAEDCSFREGPYWLADRIQRGRNRRPFEGKVHLMELEPGSRARFKKELAKRLSSPDGQPVTAGVLPRTFSLAVGTILLLLTFGLALISTWPTAASTTRQGMLRIGINHASPVKIYSTSVVDDLPEGISPEDVLGGERFPVHLKLEIDGELIEEWTFQPRGLRKEVAAYGLKELWLDPDTYHVRLLMMDNDEDWRVVYDGAVTVEKQQVSILIFAEDQEIFILHD